MLTRIDVNNSIHSIQANHEIELGMGGGFDASDDTLHVTVRNKANRIPVGQTIMAACVSSSKQDAEAAAGAAARAAVAAAIAEGEAQEGGSTGPSAEDTAPTKKARIEK